jgi:hypothetical protein
MRKELLVKSFLIADQTSVHPLAAIARLTSAEDLRQEKISLRPRHQAHSSLGLNGGEKNPAFHSKGYNDKIVHGKSMT